MRGRSEAIRALVLAVALLPGAPAGPPDGGRTQWKLSSFTWVNRVPAEPAAPGNDHPAQISQAALQKVLGLVLAQVDGAGTPLFEPNELTALARALQEAFAAARPSEDLVLLSTQRRGGHFMDPALAVTARLFVKAGALNLIVHDARLDFMDRYSADRTLPTFVYGSRTAGTAVALKADGAANLRSDWLALPLVPVAAPPATPVESRAAAPTAPKPDQEFYDLQYQRLKALKRMRDDGLISEAEYQQKREAILKTL